MGSGVKKRIVCEILEEGIKDVREALKELEEQGKQINVVVPEWCQPSATSLRLWLFEQQSNLYTNKFDTIVSNLSQILFSDNCLNGLADKQKKEENADSEQKN